MKLTCRFRHIPHSLELVQYLEDRFLKVKKLAWRPLTAEVTFSAERHECCLQVYLYGKGTSIRASAKCDSFFDAIDKVADKLIRQMARKKHRVQDHSGTDRWRRAG